MQQEALVKLNLPQLLSGTMSGGVFSKLLPTLWVTGSDKHMQTVGPDAAPKDAITSSFGAPTIWITGATIPQDTMTTSFGANWEWDTGEASLKLLALFFQWR